MLNKLVLRALLSLSLAFSFAGAANATLISQDILFDSALDTVDEYQVIGNITISLDTMDENGYVEAGWESFTFYGFEADKDFDLFFAVVDITNITAGIESLDFDVTLFTDLSFGGYIDAYAFDPVLDNITYSFFNNANADLYDAGTLAFGAATVVPTPATLILFLTAVAGLASRRKNS
ncbi:hypothetical protein CXF85_11075 [Colwellia sp. 75C3]|uniref:PEP-CTERM sorting domain-containing protein n=1 Tax=Colwellia sp. 75C3 TaxID=888425 RepID=UPI000C324A75|nr:PEP-CTERM sorting domain-containing protein [Colwellia sp. 75C3]PKG83538.1 hypothetical protein CXF85_11075 [Colwellia sp. 75C3]